MTYMSKIELVSSELESIILRQAIFFFFLCVCVGIA
jgi:hypothetical protein